MKEHWIRIHPDDPKRRYSFPDPTTERFARATRLARYYPDNLTRDDGFQLAEVAESYHHLLNHPAGTESVIRQLRELRAELRRREKEDEEG